MSGVQHGLGVGDAVVVRPACRPSRAGGGSGPRRHPWSSAAAASWPSSSSEACLCCSRSSPASRRWSGTSSPRISRARSTRAPAATAARAERRRLASSKLASRLAVARTSRRIRRSSQASTASWAPSRVSMRADGVAVADDDPVDPAHLAGLGRDAEPARRTDEGQRRLGPGAGDLEGRGPARLGERAVGQEGPAPGGLGVARREPLTTCGGQPAHRAAPAVDQAGLPGQRLAVLDHPHDVAAALAQPAGREHEDLGGVAVDLGELASQPPRGVGRVQLRLDDDAPPDDVQPPGEPQRRGRARTRPTRRVASEAISELYGHNTEVLVLRRAACARAAATWSGSSRTARRWPGRPACSTCAVGRCAGCPRRSSAGRSATPRRRGAARSSRTAR